MIKINLLAEKKAAKVKKPSAFKIEGIGANQNFLLAGILLLAVVIAGGWWFVVHRELEGWKVKHADADTELARLKPIREKADRYERRKELLERKIELITELKKKQTVPVRILEQVSKNLPEFLWLNSMTATDNRINIAGKATTYNAVSNFYKNLTASGFFGSVTLGRTFEVPEGVSFSLSCEFAYNQAMNPAGAVQG